MKKNKNYCGITAIAVVIVYAALSLTGCPDDGGGSGGKDILDGTTWKSVGTVYNVTLEFNSPNVVMTGAYDGESVYRGTYTVTGNTVTIISVEWGGTQTGTLVGNTLIIDDTTFIKTENGGNNGSGGSGGVTIYTAGAYYNNAGKEVPCYWKGTARTDLQVPTGAERGYGQAITVSGRTVYTAGCYVNSNGILIPCYWTGSTRTDLQIPAGASGSGGTVIAVSGGTVYTAGGYVNSNGIRIPCYWTGTTRTDLDIPKDGDGYVHAIAVSGGTLYTAGDNHDSNGNWIPCYWKGTTRTDLEVHGDGAGVQAITVSRGTIYTAGYYRGDDKYIACYWTGTTIFDLPVPAGAEDSWALAIAADSGGAIYIAGSYINNNGIVFPYRNPCYWTGTTRTDLPVPAGYDGTVGSITISGGTVYTGGGYFYSTGKEGLYYWRGTTRTDIQVPTGAEVCAITIVVGQ